jgi:hypothetical protein
MTEQKSRYPGIQPLGDHEISRATFFGRSLECALLKAQVLANRLTVFYARSGLGKTSMLRAGIHQDLRDSDCLPLMIRVNDISTSILDGLFDSIIEVAKLQNLEVIPGDRRSLWHFFKTAEFWKDDLLQTPVLILDQFEELFTLRKPEDQQNLLRELGHLVCGDVPCDEEESLNDVLSSSDGSLKLSLTPPVIHVVLSLREDFLGLLDEASSYIPSILSNRFRLRSLNRASALEALTAPCQLVNPVFISKPFLIEENLTTEILDFLAGQAATFTRDSEEVEPYQLQLICQMIEAHVVARQKINPSYNCVTLDDLGGKQALTVAFRDYFERTIARCCEGLQGFRGFYRRTRMKKRVRNLCNHHLISAEGRRMSLDEQTIETSYGVPNKVLNNLLGSRLIRSDKRANNVYYELSHDRIAELIRGKPNIFGIRLKTVVFRGLLFLLFAVALGLLLEFAVSVESILRLNFGQAGEKNSILFEHLPVASFCLVGLYLVQVLSRRTLRGLDKLKRLSEPVHADIESSTLHLSSHDSEGLLIDGFFTTLSLLKSPSLLFVLAMTALAVNLPETIANIREGPGLGYSNSDHPFLFASAAIGYSALFGSVVLSLSCQNPGGSFPPLHLERVRKFFFASLKGFMFTGIWFWAILYYADFTSKGMLVWLLMIISIVAFSLLFYRYMYLSVVLSLEHHSLAISMRRSRHLAGQNRWSTIVAQVVAIGAYYALIFPLAITAADILTAVPLKYVVVFLHWFSLSLLAVWLAVINYLGYEDAREQFGNCL